MKISEIQRQIGWGFMITAIMSLLIPVQFACFIVAISFWKFSWDNAKEYALEHNNYSKESEDKKSTLFHEKSS